MPTDTNCDTASSRNSVIQPWARRGKEVLVSFTKQCQVWRCETCVVFSDRSDIVLQFQLDVGLCSQSTMLNIMMVLDAFWNPYAQLSQWNNMVLHLVFIFCSDVQQFFWIVRMQAVIRGWVVSFANGWWWKHLLGTLPDPDTSFPSCNMLCVQGLW